MEQGPVLIITFIAQQIIYVTDTSGKVVEGDKVSFLLLIRYILLNYLKKTF